MGSVSAVTGAAIYLDANILIYAVEDAAGWGQRVRPLFDRINRGELRGVTSDPALAEVLVKPIRDGARRRVPSTSNCSTRPARSSSSRSPATS